MVFGGKMFTDPKEHTFKDLNIPDQGVINVSVPPPASAGKNILKFTRFSRIRFDDYFLMETYKDAVVVKPKMDITFYGFGMVANYE